MTWKDETLCFSPSNGILLKVDTGKALPDFGEVIEH